MLAESTEKAEEKIRNDCQRRASNVKEVPRWIGVSNISCSKLNELFCCQRVTHSVLFYVLVFLFLLVFLYILRKLVSLQNGYAKYNNRKHSNNGSATTTVRNHSSDSLSKRRPIKWPKVEQITSHLPAHLSEFRGGVTLNDKKSRIYHWENENSAGLLKPDNFNLNNNEINVSQLKGFTNNYLSFPDVSANSHDRVDEESGNHAYNSDNNNNIEASSASTSFTGTQKFLSTSGYGSDDFAWSPLNGPERSVVEKTSADSSASNYLENSGFKSRPDEWSSWENPDISGVQKPDTDWSASTYFGNSGLGSADTSIKNRIPDYNGDDFLGRSNIRSQQMGNWEFGNKYSKWTPTTSSWIKWGSNWPAGSGFGWLRASDQDKNSYLPQSSLPATQFPYGVESGNWAYSGSKLDNGFNQNIFGNKPSHPTYTNSFSQRTWNSYYNYEGNNQTEDWKNFNALSRRHDSASRVSTTAKKPNTSDKQDKLPKNEQGGKEERIHRWPLEEGRVEKLSFHSGTQPHGELHDGDFIKPSNKHKNLKKKQSFVKVTQQQPINKDLPGRAKSNGKHSRKTVNSVNRSMTTRTKKTPYAKMQGNNYTKKSRIPHYRRAKFYAKRRNLKRVKSKLRSKRKHKIQGKTNHALGKVSHLRTPSQKIKRTKSIYAERSRRFPSYTSYISYTKKHKISDILVGNWHRNRHHVKRCKALSQFNTNGVVQLSRRYLHRKRKYQYTLLTCRNVDTSKKTDDDSNDADSEHDSISRNNQICREFWYITTGIIRLRKISKDSGNIYALTLCKSDNFAENGEEGIPIKSNGLVTTDDDDHTNVDSDEMDKHATRMNDRNDADDSDTNNDDYGNDTNVTEESGDHKSDSGDDESDTDSRNSNDKNNDDDNDKDFDSDDNVSDNDELDDDGLEINGRTHYKTAQNKDSEDDKLNDETELDTDIRNRITEDKDVENDDNMTAADDALESDKDQSENKGDFDNDVRMDDDLDYFKEENHKHNNLRKKTKKNENKKRKSNIGMTKSFIPKLSKKRAKVRKRIKHGRKRNHKITKNDENDDQGNVYQRVLEELTKTDDMNDKNHALAKLLATILQRKSHSVVIAKRVKSKKTHSRLRIRHVKNRKVASKKKYNSTFSMAHVENANDIKTLLQNLVTNPSVAPSHLQARMKQKPSAEKGKKESPMTVAPKSTVQTGIESVLKSLLPGILSRSSSVTAVAPNPTVQTTTKPTSLSNQKVPTPNVVGKIRIKDDSKEKIKAALEGFFTRNTPKRPHNVQITDTVSSRSTVNPVPSTSQNQGLGLLNTSRLPSGNPNEESPLLTAKPVNSQRSFIPTPTPPQSYPSPQAQTQRQFSPTAHLGYATQERNVIRNIQPLRQTPYGGYQVYRSETNNFYSYQTSSVNLLCFGDSLTSGYYNHGRGKHPYTIKLNQILNGDGQHRYNIVTRGVVGEMVHGSMTKRLPKVLNKGTHYDWVIILGGTNDVAHVKNFGDDDDFTQQLISVWSPKIVKDIEKLHEIARDYGARTVLMTIPETAYEQWPKFQSIRNMRLSVNAELRKYATQVRDNTVLCDLAYKLPRSTLPNHLQKLYWNDHIHLNPIGYNKMAEYIAQCLQPYLTK